MTTARLHLRAALLVVAAEVLLRRRGATPALRRLHALSRPVAAEPAAALVAVRRFGRLARARCLAQSIALATLLDPEAHDVVVVLGCRLYADRRWGSHAWVQCDGEVLEPIAGGDHTPLARYSAEHDWVPVAPPKSEIS